VKHRAFYSGYKRRMEACLKLLAICLPNGMCGAVYGLTSGRQDDRTLLWLAQFDEFLVDLCDRYHEFPNLYCTYGDGIFAGYWTCV
jgi:hypothetical protein